MRKIKFRAKSLENNKWVYGSYINRGHHNYLYDLIIDYKSRKKAVIPETVGQYTGLKDENGNEIYEGDIIELESEFLGRREIVVFENGIFGIKDKFFNNNPVISLNEIKARYSKIVKLGNKYENSELLE